MLSKSDQILNFLHTNVQILSNWIVCGTIQQFIYSNIQNFFFKFYLRTKRDKMFVTPCYWQLIKLSVFCKVNGAIVCTEKGLECPPYQTYRVVPPGCSTHLVFYSIGILITNLQSDPFERLKNILTSYRIYSTPFIQILVLFISGLTMPDYGRFNS